VKTMSFNPERFTAAVRKLHAQYGASERFTQEFARLVFRHCGPRGLRFEEVAFRVTGRDTSLMAEMFVLGGGLQTVKLDGYQTTGKIDELANALEWVVGGDSFSLSH
jgi:hypothetical protein